MATNNPKIIVIPDKDGNPAFAMSHSDAIKVAGKNKTLTEEIVGITGGTSSFQKALGPITTGNVNTLITLPNSIPAGTDITIKTSGDLPLLDGKCLSATFRDSNGVDKRNVKVGVNGSMAVDTTNLTDGVEYSDDNNTVVVPGSLITDDVAYIRFYISKENYGTDSQGHGVNNVFPRSLNVDISFPVVGLSEKLTTLKTNVDEHFASVDSHLGDVDDELYLPTEGNDVDKGNFASGYYTNVGGSASTGSFGHYNISMANVTADGVRIVVDLGEGNHFGSTSTGVVTLWKNNAFVRCALQSNTTDSEYTLDVYKASDFDEIRISVKSSGNTVSVKELTRQGTSRMGALENGIIAANANIANNSGAITVLQGSLSDVYSKLGKELGVTDLTNVDIHEIHGSGSSPGKYINISGSISSSSSSGRYVRCIKLTDIPSDNYRVQTSITGGSSIAVVSLWNGLPDNSGSMVGYPENAVGPTSGEKDIDVSFSLADYPGATYLVISNSGEDLYIWTEKARNVGEDIEALDERVTVLEGGSPKINVLVVGNSFSLRPLSGGRDTSILKLCKQEGKQMFIAAIGNSGQSFQQNWEIKDNDAGLYNEGDEESGFTNYPTPTLSITDALAGHIEGSDDIVEWDYIIFHQWSGLSWDYSSFNPWLAKFIVEARKLCPNKKVKIGLQQTWAYGKTLNDNDYYPHSINGSVVYQTQEDFYNAICAAYKQCCEDYDIDLLIPCGTAIQNARSDNNYDGTNDLVVNSSSDNLHPNVYGTIVTCLTWYGALFGESVSGVSRFTTDCTDAKYAIAVKAAEFALALPWKTVDLDPNS